ncbi:MAG: hypothetical protein RJA10_3935 [Pseudomonadota bacterium]
MSIDAPHAPPEAVAAQAALHHQWFLGLQLMVATREGPAVMGDWMFRLFRRQHEEKFLSSFDKLGLRGLPHADACARYHVLSNGIGGVAVEYLPEGPRKAWVRFRYPRWMFDGPAVCGLPVEVSRGFLQGWYAHNGVSLGNPRLGFVCVSEDMTGEFGLCGYFQEFDHELAPDERLQFRRDERPPAFDPAVQPRPPEATWSPERLARAERNYALTYLRNGLAALAAVIGPERTATHARLSARLTGLQQFTVLARRVGAQAADGTAADALDFLARVLIGMGDACTPATTPAGQPALRQQGLRIVQGLPAAERAPLLDAWCQLWVGALAATRAIHRLQHGLQVGPGGDEALLWWIDPAASLPAAASNPSDHPPLAQARDVPR